MGFGRPSAIWASAHRAATVKTVRVFLIDGPETYSKDSQAFSRFSGGARLSEGETTEAAAALGLGVRVMSSGDEGATA